LEIEFLKLLGFSEFEDIFIAYYILII